MSILIGNEYYYFKLTFPHVRETKVRKDSVKNLSEAIDVAKERMDF